MSSKKITTKSKTAAYVSDIEEDEVIDSDEELEKVLVGEISGEEKDSYNPARGFGDSSKTNCSVPAPYFLNDDGSYQRHNCGGFFLEIVGSQQYKNPSPNCLGCCKIIKRKYEKEKSKFETKYKDSEPPHAGRYIFPYIFKDMEQLVEKMFPPNGATSSSDTDLSLGLAAMDMKRDILLFLITKRVEQEKLNICKEFLNGKIQRFFVRDFVSKNVMLITLF